MLMEQGIDYISFYVEKIGLLKDTQRKERKSRPGTPDVLYFEQELQEVLGTKVEVKCGKNPAKGSLVIHYHTLEQLNNIADRLKHKML